MLVITFAQAAAEVKTELRRRFAWIYEKLNRFLGMEQKKAGTAFSLSEAEGALIGQSRAEAEAFFGSSAGEALAGMTPERRMALIEDFSYRMLDLWGLPDCDVIITDSGEIFPGAEAASCIGKCGLEEGVIYLNSCFLQENHEGILKKCAMAVLHEVRHMMQWRAIRGQLEIPVPAEAVESWQRNLEDGYIRASADLEGYYRQPVEYDARNFACLILGEL